jgi:hypothetical protein
MGFILDSEMILVVVDQIKVNVKSISNFLFMRRYLTGSSKGASSISKSSDSDEGSIEFKVFQSSRRYPLAFGKEGSREIQLLEAAGPKT